MPLDNLDSAIDESHADFTVGFVLDKLASVGKLGQFADLANVQNAQFVQLSTGGFLSDIYRIQIQFKQVENAKEGGTTPTAFSCIFKVPTSRRLDMHTGSEKAKEDMKMWMYSVHNSECHFYATAVPLLRAMPAPLPFRIPELYACRNAASPDCLAGGYLLMEDVSGNGIIEIDLSEGLSKEQAESAIRGLAHFHALCLCLPRELVDSFTLKAELDFDEKDLHIIERITAMPDCAQSFAGQNEALKKHYNDHGHYEPDQHKMFSVAPVIVHGDFWSNNMFFKTCNGRSVADQLSAVFDWQICHTGTGVNDLLRIIYVSVDAPLRRLHFDDWLALYCSELNSVLAQLGKALPDQQHRSMEVIRQMVAHYNGYELCFQLFLLTNILGIVQQQNEQKRAKLIKRMRELYDDIC
ncbi:hypothetical protein niasHS_008128 [Heterodera schachtii]|uniref:CHK kinase-like domain-containing protein n=1 Tax=Heterodera schachtii TaxID=97005 RepID=A0ABD2J391_HETSC